MTDYAALLFLTLVFGDHPCGTTGATIEAVMEYGKPADVQFLSRDNGPDGLGLTWIMSKTQGKTLITSQHANFGQACVTRYRTINVPKTN